MRRVGAGGEESESELGVVFEAGTTRICGVFVITDVDVRPEGALELVGDLSGVGVDWWDAVRGESDELGTTTDDAR